MSFLKKLIADGPVAAVTMTVSNLLHIPVNAAVVSRIDTVCSVALQIIASLLAAPLSLPVSVVTGLTALHTVIYNLEDLLDNGKLDQSVKR